MSREGHGRDRVSLNYRSFMFGKLPPPACPGLCYYIYYIYIYNNLYGYKISQVCHVMNSLIFQEFLERLPV